MSQRCQFQTRAHNEEPLFDHTVRSRDKDGWKIEANCFRGFKVDDQFKSARPLDRQVAGLEPRKILSTEATAFCTSSRFVGP